MKGKRFTKEQIISVLKESEAGGETKEVCRRHGISEATLYNWKAKYAGIATVMRPLMGETAYTMRKRAPETIKPPQSSGFGRNRG